ncbi:MAG: thioredoxin domain-containing protein [Planctomycetes bacterium]|nr:thioredoxin domain-containing protein [Planctomycetota bacterium]
MNRLAKEKSPYLLQHATNPVDWWPWCDEAFEKARRENKPVFLSIGYSSCHWCHVMEHESFADEAVAAYLNEHYVCVKVDREERPDVDEVYMSAVQLMRIPGDGPSRSGSPPTASPSWAGPTSRPARASGAPASSTSCGVSSRRGTSRGCARRSTRAACRSPRRSSRSTTWRSPRGWRRRRSRRPPRWPPPTSTTATAASGARRSFRAPRASNS